MSPSAVLASGTARGVAQDQGNVQLSGRRLVLAQAITLGLAAGGRAAGRHACLMLSHRHSPERQTGLSGWTIKG